MSPNNSDIIITLAIEHYLVRLGIKTLIHRLGIEPFYCEWSSPNQLNILRPQHSHQFLIFTNSQCNNHQLSLLTKQFNPKNVLQINIHSSLKDNRFRHISLNESKENILLQLEDFFSSVLQTENGPDNRILSTREVDVLKEVALGYPNKEIADHLFISINTVITHRKNITEKLGIKTIPGLTVYALMNKLIDPKNVT